MKSGTVVIVIDGVLRKLVGSDPIPSGLQLFKAVATEFAVVLVSNMKQDDEMWLSGQGVQYDMLYGQRSDVTRLQAVKELHFEYGYDIAFVVEPDPDQAAELVSEGLTVLGFIHPYYAHPSWRPLHGPGSAADGWAKLRWVVMRDRMERAAEKRLERQDEEIHMEGFGAGL